MKKKTPENVVVEYADWSKLLPWLTQIAFVLSLGLVIARALMLEFLREPMETLNSAIAPPKPCGPAGSVVLDLICIVPALLVLLRRIIDKSYIVRFTLAEVLLAAFAGWALLSTIWAPDRFQALILSFHLVAGAALFWAMAQLVRSWARLRLVAGLCMGILLVYIGQGLMYRFVDLPDTVSFWKAHRTEEMQSHGWKEGDFQLQQYEQKLKNGEMVVFSASPNTLAATMVLLGVIVAGVGIQRIVNKDESGLIGATFLPLPLAGWIIGCTHSNTAFVTPVIAGLMLFVVWKFSGLLNRKRSVVFALGVGAVVVGTGALIGHGLFHGSLPTASLNFRRRYWVASMQIVKAHRWLGVGFGNFGNAYLGVRLPAAGEEIKDPHNLVVRAMTELGLIGAALLVAWLIRVWWEWTRPIVPSAPVKVATDEHGSRRMFIAIASLSTLGTLIKLAAGIDWGGGSGVDCL